MVDGMNFEITHIDTTIDVILDADGYAQEGPMTTFFQTERGRAPRLDPWALRLLSLRTDRILRIEARPNSDIEVRPNSDQTRSVLSRRGLIAVS